MRYVHFTKDERNELSVLLKKGYSIRDIGYTLRRSPSSVSREINKNKVKGQYDSKKAHHKAYVRRKYSKYQGMKIVENRCLEGYINEKMKLNWSPEQITGRLKLENGNKTVITTNTIYKYLYSPYGYCLCQYLKYKRYKKRRRKAIKSIREIIKGRVFIEERPEVANQRLRYGDFEGDALGTPKGGKETLVALIERKSRYLLAKKISRLKQAMGGFKELLSLVPALSVTFDNGSENARFKELGIPTYFCHPYHSWEKGAVENALGLIREYIPKKKSLVNYSDQDISDIVEIINNTPRKCLGFRTPSEVFNEHYLSKFHSSTVALEGTMHFS